MPYRSLGWKGILGKITVSQMNVGRSNEPKVSLNLVIFGKMQVHGVPFLFFDGVRSQEEKLNIFDYGQKGRFGEGVPGPGQKS